MTSSSATRRCISLVSAAEIRTGVLIFALCACGGNPSTSAPVAVVQVQVSPATARIALTQTQSFSATALDAGGQPLVGRSAAWSVSDPTIASVSASGVVVPVRAGQTQVNATIGGVVGSAILEAVDLSPAQVVLTPASITIALGQTATLTATVKDPTGAITTGWALTWSTSNAQVATVDGGGLVKGVANGSATITASAAGVTGSAAITVQTVVGQVHAVTVSPANAATQIGGTAQFTAAVTADPGVSTAVTWQTADGSKASVSSTGLVTALAATSGVNVCATSVATPSQQGCGVLSIGTPGGVTTISTIRTSAVSVLPQALTLTVGQTATLAGTYQSYASYFTWTSSNSTVVTVDNLGYPTNTIRAVAVGTVAVSATIYGQIASVNVNVIAGNESVRGVVVTPPTQTLAVGGTVQLASVVTADAGVSQAVSWATSDSSRATVSSSGFVKAIAATPAVAVCAISVVAPSRLGCATLTVGANGNVVVVQPAAIIIGVGQTATLAGTLNLYAAYFTWASSNSAVATVDNLGYPTNTIRGVAPGTTVIFATLYGSIAGTVVTVR